MSATTITGVLFDYSGTLFHLEPRTDWFDGHNLQPARVAELLTSPTIVEQLPAGLTEAWERRDLDAETHRMVYLVALGTALSGVPDDVLESIYRRVPDPASWRPYPDTLPALRAARAAGLRTGVVSNIAWDIAGVFERNGMAELVDTYVLSYAEGVMKPDPKIFRTACERLDVEPGKVLMIGDNEEADGGARRIGCRFAHVERVPPAERPNALVAALAAHGIEA